VTGECPSLLQTSASLLSLEESMPILQDPEENEIRALLKYAVSFEGKSVLEIGCGDGRLTWRYAGDAAHVTGIDPDTERYQRALADFPPQLKSKVELHNIELDDFAAQVHTDQYDIAILSWSL
jgi:cyclopropane fatty-acyl-phospholipid synthase-like methyltransferase